MCLDSDLNKSSGYNTVDKNAKIELNRACSKEDRWTKIEMQWRPRDSRRPRKPYQ